MTTFIDMISIYRLCGVVSLTNTYFILSGRDITLKPSDKVHANKLGDLDQVKINSLPIF